MKEYEYVAQGIDEYLIDQLVGVICIESFEGKAYPNGFRKIYDEFMHLHQSFLNQSSHFHSTDPQEMRETNRIAWEKKRQIILNAFMKYAKNNCNGLDVDGLYKAYKDKLNEEDQATIEKRIMFYPYLTRKMREWEVKNCDET